MSKDVAGRDYSLRNSGRSIKYTADGKCLGKVCNNCTLLSLEIDKLRRQIALLTKHVQDTPSNDNVIDNSADISLKHENRGTKPSGQVMVTTTLHPIKNQMQLISPLHLIDSIQVLHHTLTLSNWTVTLSIRTTLVPEMLHTMVYIPMFTLVDAMNQFPFRKIRT